MLIDLTDIRSELPRNAVFRRHALMYREIWDDYHSAVEDLGLPFESRSAYEDRLDSESKKLELSVLGAVFGNGGRSISSGWVSPSCIQCRRGMNTLTLGISTYCPRKCYFCFNANQDGAEHVNDVCAELDSYRAREVDLTDIALTGGEPLIHRDETIAFFRHSKELYPQAYTRLYTSGAFLDESVLRHLHTSGLDEIRLSVKLEESGECIDSVLSLIALSRSYIPNVMVEMPVAPDQVDRMKELLVDLDRLGVRGINLLEFCYPLNNAEEFLKRGYSIRHRPFKVLYDYWYAGGLPIAGSEEACLELLRFALTEKLAIGCHYCSLENKFTSQLYLQNRAYGGSFGLHRLSDDDCFLKCAKAFGEDIRTVTGALDEMGSHGLRYSEAGDCVMFPFEAVPLLAKRAPDMEIGISYCVAEPSRGGAASADPSAAGEVLLRELKIDMTTPRLFMIEDAL